MPFHCQIDVSFLAFLKQVHNPYHSFPFATAASYCGVSVILGSWVRMLRANYPTSHHHEM